MRLEEIKLVTVFGCIIPIDSIHKGQYMQKTETQFNYTVKRSDSLDDHWGFNILRCPQGDKVSFVLQVRYRDYSYPGVLSQLYRSAKFSRCQLKQQQKILVKSLRQFTILEVTIHNYS